MKRHLLTAALLVSPLSAAERVAFVAGNCAYTTFSRLDNPKQDAAEVSRVLTALGFAVTKVDDLSAADLKKQFTAFSAAHPDAKEIVFYFSGHGLQVHGENYLTGTDSTLFDAVKRAAELKALLPDEADRTSQLEKETRRDADRTMWSLSDLTGTLERTGQKEAVRLVILDSCRDNPAGTKTVLPSKGFVKAEAPSGMLIAFAAKEGTTAGQTGAGETSLYTKSLLKFLREPGLTAEQVFKKTRAEVIKVSDGAQEPREYSSLTGELVFLPGGQAPVPDDLALLAKLADMEKKLAELEKAGGSSKAEAERLKAELAAMSIPSRAAPVPGASGKGFTNTLGMKFLPVPGTTVQFCIHETRSKDFAAFIADRNRGYTMSGDDADDWRTNEHKEVPVGRGASESAENSAHPVANVSWLDAVAFCEWLSKKEGKTYRLPTDAEWSKAVGLTEGAGTPEELDGGVEDEYPWGGKFVSSAISGNYADDSAKAKGTGSGYIEGYRDGFATTAPVMSFTANQHGLYDLGGNLYEWVAGCYDGTDPNGKDKTLTSSRALRGGSWRNGDPGYLLSSGRFDGDPGLRSFDFGFRVVVVGSGG